MGHGERNRNQSQEKRPDTYTETQNTTDFSLKSVYEKYGETPLKYMTNIFSYLEFFIQQKRREIKAFSKSMVSKLVIGMLALQKH